MVQQPEPTRQSKLGGWLTILFWAAAVLGAAIFVRPFGSVWFFAAFGAGYTAILTALPSLMKSDRLPTDILGARRVSRRLGIVATYLLLALSLALSLAGSRLYALAMIGGLVLFGLILRPYQNWALGLAGKLDEYHLAHGHRARSWAYTGLVLISIAGLAVAPEIPGLKLSDLPYAAMALGILFVYVPATILGWNEPDHD